MLSPSTERQDFLFFLVVDGVPAGGLRLCRASTSGRDEGSLPLEQDHHLHPQFVQVSMLDDLFDPGKQLHPILMFASRSGDSP